MVLADAAEARLDLSPGLGYFLGQLSRALLSPGSQISLALLLCALSIRVVRVGSAS